MAYHDPWCIAAATAHAYFWHPTGFRLAVYPREPLVAGHRGEPTVVRSCAEAQRHRLAEIICSHIDRHESFLRLQRLRAPHADALQSSDAVSIRVIAEARGPPSDWLI